MKKKISKKMLELLYGHLGKDQLRRLIETRDIRYADAMFYKTKMLEEAYEKLGGVSDSRPDMMLMSPKQYEAMKNAFVSMAIDIDKKRKKK